MFLQETHLHPHHWCRCCLRNNPAARAPYTRLHLLSEHRNKLRLPKHSI